MSNPYDQPRALKRDKADDSMLSMKDKVSRREDELPPIVDGEVVSGEVSFTSPSRRRPEQGAVPVFSESTQQLLSTVAKQVLDDVVAERAARESGKTATVSNAPDTTATSDEETSPERIEQLKEELRVELRNEYLAAISERRYDNTEIDNHEVRLAVEKRTTPMDLSALVIAGRVTQTVEVLPGNKLVVTFRSLKKSDRHWLDSFVSSELPMPDYKENETIKETNERLRENDKVAAARNMLVIDGLLVLQIESVAFGSFSFDMRSVFPHNNKTPDKSAFRHNLEIIRDMDSTLSYLLSVNLKWFNDRVKSLYHEDFLQLKNS